MIKIQTPTGNIVIGTVTRFYEIIIQNATTPGGVMCTNGIYDLIYEYGILNTIPDILAYDMAEELYLIFKNYYKSFSSMTEFMEYIDGFWLLDVEDRDSNTMYQHLLFDGKTPFETIDYRFWNYVAPQNVDDESNIWCNDKIDFKDTLI